MLYAIGDLHLSHGSNKPMDIFGKKWYRHDVKIKKNWHELVRENDVVIIPGDISWGQRMDGFLPDYEYLKNLPGKKILVRGNHDFWWDGVGKLNSLNPDFFFLQNNCTVYNNVFICGTRGWVCPNDKGFTSHDMKIYKREAGRLKLSLESAMTRGAEEIIVAMHYPPFFDINISTLFTDIFQKYPIRKVIYGHLHFQGEVEESELYKLNYGIEFRLVSADAIEFKPVKIID